MKRVLKYAIPVAAIIAQGIDEPANASDIVLKMDGVDGESTVAKHEGEIDVLAWSWGVSNTGIEFGGGGSAKSTFTPIKIIKSVDAATADLVANAAIGAPIGEATLYVLRDVGVGDEEYMKLTLTQLMVTKVAHGGKDTEQGVAETVTLDWTQLKVEYRKYDGKGWGTWEETCWDRELSKSC